jgi:hypothetical protein
LNIYYRVRLPLFLVITGIFLLGSQCEPEIIWGITSRVDEAIDVSRMDGWSFNDDEREYFKSLSIGDRGLWFGCSPCKLEPDKKWSASDFPLEGRDVTIAARSSITQQLVYHQVFSYTELASRNWQVEITDMREPGTRMTDPPFPDRTSTLVCSDCKDINLWNEGTYRSNGAYTSIYYYGGRLRTYGSAIPKAGKDCHEEGIFLERNLVVDGAPSGNMHGEWVAGVKDKTGFEALYIYTIAGYSVDEILIRNGVAHAAGPDGQHWEHLKAVEEQARTEGTGCLWQD